MLIEFRVENFRSILDEQCLSLVASSGKEMLDTNTFDPDIPGVPRLVRSACLFGPNASGKSNIVKAMAFMAAFVSESAAESKPGERISVEPFLLDQTSENKPSRFEVIFAAGDVRYKYGFSLDRYRVLSEWLFAAPEGRDQCWFERDSDAVEKGSWYFGPNLRGQKRVIQDSTRDNALFLSTAAQLNNPQLRQVWEWFETTFKSLTGARRVGQSFSTMMCDEEDGRKRVVELLQQADLGIDDVDVRKEEWKDDDFPADLSEEVKKKILAQLPDHKMEPLFLHKKLDSDDLVAFEYESESAGTQAFFSLAGPWLDVLNNGYVLVLDELDSSLHPFLAEHLVRQFLGNKRNPFGAQLIFTAHNPHLLNSNLLRRDQVWFVAKPKLATQLRAHTEFRPRKDEDRIRGYLGGRYGSLPFLDAANSD